MHGELGCSPPSRGEGGSSTTGGQWTCTRGAGSVMGRTTARLAAPGSRELGCCWKWKGAESGSGVSTGQTRELELWSLISGGDTAWAQVLGVREARCRRLTRGATRCESRREAGNERKVAAPPSYPMCRLAEEIKVLLSPSPQLPPYYVNCSLLRPTLCGFPGGGQRLGLRDRTLSFYQ